MQKERLKKINRTLSDFSPQTAGLQQAPLFSKEGFGVDCMHKRDVLIPPFPLMQKKEAD